MPVLEWPLFLWSLTLVVSGFEGDEWGSVEALEHPRRPQERRPHPHCDQPVAEAEP